MIRIGMVMMVAGAALTGALAAQPEPAAPSDTAREKSGVEAQLNQTALLMARGEQAWRQGDLAQASNAYGDALDILEMIETGYPGVAPLIVRSRILACESAIEKIRDGKPAAPAEKVAEPESNKLDNVAFALTPGTAEKAIKALKAGLDERDATLADLRLELQEVRRENSRLKGQAAMESVKSAPTQAVKIAPTILKGQAREWMATGSGSNAVALLNEMKSLFPGDTSVSHLLGIAYCRQGDFMRALGEVEPVIKKGRAPADIWLTLGVACMGIGELGKARQAFEESLDLDPKLAEAHFNLAQILIRLKKPDAEAARSHYMTALQLGSERDTTLELAINRALLDQQVKKLKR